MSDNSSLPVLIPSDQAVSQIADYLNLLLTKHKSVLWLTSGGSCIDVSVTVLRHLKLTGAGKLSVGLIDERYVDLDSTNSNWQQLTSSEFSNSALQLYPILKPNLSHEATAEAYSQQVEQLFNENDVSFGLFGMGADGHTAGLLPGCPLLSEQKLLVGSYTGPDFKRISLTPAGIARLDQVVLYAAGENKWPQLERLSQALPASEMPAQLLKKFQPLKVYTDYKGDAQ